MSKLVWRVQLADGGGMYTSRALACTNEMNYDPYDENKNQFARIRHPCPHDDYLLEPQWYALGGGERFRYRFGFASIDQLLSWIYMDEWHQEIHSAGFKVYVYSVPDAYVCIGATQACFHQEHGELISVVDIVDLT